MTGRSGGRGEVPQRTRQAKGRARKPASVGRMGTGENSMQQDQEMQEKGKAIVMEALEEGGAYFFLIIVSYTFYRHSPEPFLHLPFCSQKKNT